MKRILLILLFILMSCGPDISVSVPLGPGSQDFSSKLPNGYILFRSSAHQIQVVPEDGWNDSIPTIPTKVIEMSVVDQYVLAKRQGLKRRSPNDPDDTYMEPDPTVFDYWILDTAKPSVLGPMTNTDFLDKAKDLGVADRLNLRDIYDYDNR